MLAGRLHVCVEQVSTVAGPLLGGFFVDNLSWRWIYYINLPLGVVALAVISIAFRSPQTIERHRIDYLGTVVLAAGLSGRILYASPGGTTYPWDGPGMLAAIVGGAALLGLTMQVLVLTAQNAVDYRLLGVATSGASLARQVGGSIGVSLFGAIFTNRLGHELAQRLPPGVHAPAQGSPAVVQHLPPVIHAAYIAAYAAALHPVFLTAAAVMLGAFGLSWLLRDVPLRETAGAAGNGESFAELREASRSYGEDTSRRVFGDDDRVPREDAAALSHIARAGSGR
jgi:MFS family permease